MAIDSRQYAGVRLTEPHRPETNHLLKANLKQLRLPTIHAEYEKLAREAGEANQPYDQYLLQLTEMEVATRQANALASRIKQADFPSHKDLDSFDFTAVPSLNKQQVLELTRGQWIEQHHNVCMIGNSGTGETHLATAIGLAACRLGKRVAVAQMVMRQKQYLVAIQVVGEALVMHTMHYGDEVQGIEEIQDDLPRDIKTNKKEVEAAEQLIESMSGAFDPSQYQDDYQQQMRELIEAKAEGEGVRAVAEESEEDIPPTFDLMEALKKSVAQRTGKNSGKGTKRKTKGRRKSA